MSRFVRFTLLSCGVVLAFGISLVLARNYQFELGARALKVEDYATALRRLRPLTSLGDGHAQYILGEMYAFGTGVPKDDSEAIYWFRRAAIGAHGEPDPAAAAELAVARSYAEGIGVKVDTDESIKWLRKAAQGGNKDAAAELERSHGSLNGKQN